jgi:uncharacterized phage-associated protein
MTTSKLRRSKKSKNITYEQCSIPYLLLRLRYKIKVVIVAFIKRAGLTRGDYMVCTATELSDYLVDKAKSENIELTPLKLQKILYYVQGWYLAFKDTPVFDEDVLAWKYGPVVKEVYNKFSPYGAQNIAISDYKPETSCEFNTDDKDIINAIWDKYKSFKPTELVTMTHLSKPWKQVFYDPNNEIIYTDLMRDYFKQYATPARNS